MGRKSVKSFGVLPNSRARTSASLLPTRKASVKPTVPWLLSQRSAAATDRASHVAPDDHR